MVFPSAQKESLYPFQKLVSNVVMLFKTFLVLEMQFEYLEAAGTMAQDPQITLQENCQEIKLFNLFFCCCCYGFLGFSFYIDTVR